MTMPYGLEFNTSFKEANTAKGDYQVYEAKPTQAFWNAWRGNKVKMFNQGYNCIKHDDEWKVQKWVSIPNKVLTA